MTRRGVDRLVVAVVAMAVSSALVFSGSAPATAETEQSSAVNDVSRVESISSGIDARALSALAKEGHRVGGRLGTINTAPRPGTPNVIVAAPLTGPGLSEGSFIAAVLDDQTSANVSTIALRVRNLAADRAHVSLDIDGTRVSDQEVAVTVESRAQAEALRGDLARGSSNVIKCLNALGISTLAAVAIISTCAAFCAVTVGAGCIVCVAGFTAAAGAAVGRCFSK